MALIKRLLLISVFFVVSFFLLACSNNINLTDDKINTQMDRQDFVWSITLKSSETADDLSTTKAAVQYNGDITHVSYKEKPGGGNTFLLIELIIEKKKPGASKFEWANLYVLDSTGAKFYRHPNDTFLESFNFSRIKSTDLTFGKNEGFICFEISKQASKGKLYLVYNSLEGENRIKLK